MSNNKQQTAVEQLAIALYEGGYLKGHGDEIQNLVDKAKEMEKEQIINDYCNGRISVVSKEIISYEQYYEQTYGGNK